MSRYAIILLVILGGGTGCRILAQGEAVAVTGQVVDASKQPVANAVVSFHEAPDPLATSKTDENGRFKIALNRPIGVHLAWVEARDAQGRTGVDLVFALEHRPLHQGETITIAESFSLEVRVPEGSASGSRVHGTLRLDQMAGLFRLPLRTVEFGDHEQIELKDLPSGTYRVTLFGSPDTRGEAVVVLSKDQEVEIVLEPSRSAEVVVVDRETGEPISGAAVEVAEGEKSDFMPSMHDVVLPNRPAPTDSDGHTVVRALPRDRALFFYAAASGYGRTPGRYGVEVGPEASEVRIELPPFRPVAWEVKFEDGPPLPDGSEVRLWKSAGGALSDDRTTGKVEDGRLIVAGLEPDLWARLLASTNDGRVCRLSWEQGAATPRPAVFRAARLLRVKVIDEDGRPIPGVSVQVHLDRLERLHAPVSTDAKGMVAIDGLPAERVQVHLGINHKATVDLGREDGETTITFPRTRTLVIKVKVDDRTELPSDTKVLLWGAKKGSLVRDPEAAELRLEVTPDASDQDFRVEVRARGYADAHLTVPAGIGEHNAVAHLVSTGAIDLAVRPPADGIYEVGLQVWEPGSESWSWRDPLSLGPPLGPSLSKTGENTFAIRDLEAGRYRPGDSRSGLVGDPVDLGPGETARTVLNLKTVTEVHGRVLVPEDRPPSEARIMVEGDCVAPRLSIPVPEFRGLAVGDDGSFSLRVPTGRDVVIRAWHPYLISQTDPILIGDAIEELTFALAHGPYAILRPDPMPDLGTRYPQSMRVLLWMGEPVGEPISEHRAFIYQDTIWFGGYRPGTYTVWLDTPPFIPIVALDQELLDGRIDYGSVHLGRGSTVFLKLVLPEGQRAPKIRIFAERLGQPHYTRLLFESKGEMRPGLFGLGPGRFKVEARKLRDLSWRWEREIEVDGESDLEFEVPVQ